MQASPTSAVRKSVLQSNCPQTEAVFRRTDNGYARIYFLKRSMSTTIIDSFFKDGHFRIDQTFDLPSNIVLRLQLKESKLYPGLYKVIEYKDYFIIDFEPSQKSRGTTYAQD